MTPTSPLLFIAGIWAVTALIVCGYPLVTGRIRFGGPGSEPIWRETQPERFWSIYAVSTGLFLAVSGGAAWMLAHLLKLA